jgi:hypothetical protein
MQDSVIAFNGTIVPLTYIKIGSSLTNQPFWSQSLSKGILPDLWPSDFHFFAFRNNLKSMLSALRPTPNLKDQVPVFITPSDRVAQLYLQALGSLFVAFYDS